MWRHRWAAEFRALIAGWIKVDEGGDDIATVMAANGVVFMLTVVYYQLPKGLGIAASVRYANATQPTVSRPFLARFPPFFRRSFALSGFLAPRRRERAKNGGKWAKFGGETGEKQRWLSGVGDRWT